jgi:hypothetical protein
LGCSKQVASWVSILSNNSIKIMKSAPFDLYESRLSDTRFDSWEAIKHNIINGYADFYQESSATGLIIFCDHVNGYSLVDNLFTLTLGLGYHGNLWWGYQPLHEKCKIKYSILPHQYRRNINLYLRRKGELWNLILVNILG